MKILNLGGVPMISNQESLTLSPFMAIYDMVVPKDNMLRQINERTCRLLFCARRIET